MPTEWFRRLGDIPGLDYETPAGIDRSAIPGHDAVPEVNRFGLSGGEVHEQLSWPRTVEPPPGAEEPFAHLAPVGAYLQAFYAGDRQPAERLIRCIHEALELPGTASDYHFAIQQALPELRSRMLEEPQVVAHIEAFAWLDIRLAQAYPQAVSSDFGDDQFRYYVIEAFDALSNLYSGEGFLNEALEVARIAQQFQQGEQRRTALQERLAAIHGEDSE